MRATLAILLLSASAFCLAQSNPTGNDQEKKKPDPINPDRPDFTDGAGITPIGKVLLELGYRQTHTPGSTLQEWGDGPTLRYGFNERFEIRVVAPTYAAVTGDKGLEDGGAGFKWLLKDGGDAGGFRKPSYALEGTTTVPTGTNSFRTRRFLPRVNGIVDWDFGSAGELSGNVAVASQLNGTGRTFALWSASLSYAHSLSEKLTGYFEKFALIPTAGNGPVGHFVDGGFQFLLNNDCMLDASAGTETDLHRQTAFFAVGVSFRF